MTIHCHINGTPAVIELGDDQVLVLQRAAAERPLGATELAKHYGLSVRTVRRMVAAREIPFRKIRGKLEFSLREVEEARAKRKVNEL